MSSDSSLTGQSTPVSVLAGAAVTVVVSFVPLSPILGGAVAAYLRGADRGEGIRVGALAGAVAAVPVLAVLALVFGFLSFGSLLGGSSAGGVLFFLLLLVGVGLSLVYSAGLSALGGYLGAYLLERESSGPGSAVAAERAREEREARDAVRGSSEEESDEPATT
jgi:hypothetical protein